MECNNLIRERRRRLQYLFQGVFKMLSFFKITLIITYANAVTLRDQFQSCQTFSNLNLAAG